MRRHVSTLVPALLLVLTACNREDSSTARRDDERIARVENGLRPAVVLAGEPVSTRTLADAMRQTHVPGVSVAVIHDGRIAWAKGYGLTAEGGVAVTPTTPFQAGSISKPVAAVAALRLIEEGKLTLDGDVNEYLETWEVPDNPSTAGRAVTLRGLLSHTAGVNVRGFPGYASTAAVPSLLEVLDGRPPANTPPIRVVSEPGTEWSYSGGGYAIVQQLVADVTGGTFEDWTREHVLAPIGMTHSGFAQPLRPQELRRAAKPHDVRGRAVAGGPHLYPERAAAGLWTTPSDLSRFLIDMQEALAGGRHAALNPATARRMLQPVIDRHAMGFDLGGSAAAGYFTKGGDTEGFVAFMVAYRGRGDGAVVMTNGARGGELAMDVVRGIADAYAWPDFQSRVRTPVALDRSTLAHYAGTYTYGEPRRFTIRVDRGHLTIASPGEPVERLYAESSTRLFVLSQNVTFVVDAEPNHPVRTGHIEVAGQRLPFHRVTQPQ